MQEPGPRGWGPPQRFGSQLGSAPNPSGPRQWGPPQGLSSQLGSAPSYSQGPSGWGPPQGPASKSGSMLPNQPRSGGWGPPGLGSPLVSTPPNLPEPRKWGSEQGPGSTLGSTPPNQSESRDWGSEQGSGSKFWSAHPNPPGPKGWRAPQGHNSPKGTAPPNPPGGFQNFKQNTSGPGPRFSSGSNPQQGPPFNNRMPQQGPQTGNRMSFNHQERPLIRPSQFSGPPKGPGSDRPPFTNNSNQFGNRNPFGQGPGPRFGNHPPNGPPGMMRGPRPNFHRPNGPRFHQQPFNKNKPKSQHPNQNNNNGEKKEVKFFCDSCDRGYKDEDKYQEHVNGHEKCKYEGCSYVAAPKLVQLHINLQHRSGLAKKIWSLESPEDIKKWREDRKKNFPTATNIAKKKADRASREERGEVIQEEYFGRMYGGRGRGRDRGRGRGRGGRFDRRGGHQNGSCSPTGAKQRKLEGSDEQKDELNSKNVKNQPPSVQETKQPDGDPLSIILDGGDSDNDEHAEKSSPSKLSAAGGLGSLMSSYVVDSSEEEGEIKSGEAPTSAVESRLGTSNKEISSQDTRDGNHNDIKRTNQHEDGKPKQSDCNQSEHGNHRNRKRNRKGQQKKWEPGTSGKFEPPPRIFDRSLLAKLLAKDIRRERNKILQCVHYIVKKDFFGIGKTSSKPTPSDSAIIDLS